MNVSFDSEVIIVIILYKIFSKLKIKDLKIILKILKADTLWLEYIEDCAFSFIKVIIFNWCIISFLSDKYMYKYTSSN